MSVLATPVHVEGGSRPFGELTLHDVEARAQELGAAVGFGPTARVAPVARAWAALAHRMREAGAPTVAALGEEAAVALAEALWVRPPGGSLL